jgi:arsenite-transporting ATPase
VSTDPAHSLGDALGVTLSSSARQIARGLDAIELDGPRAFARWLRDHRHALADILEHGTWLDRNDVDALMNLSLPGIDELVGLLEISWIATAKRYELIVVDTAPTGHTLRLLAAPETVGVVSGVLDALQEDHRLIRDRLARVRRGPEAADQLIALLATEASGTAARLRDRRQASFRWVTLPEMMSVEETVDAVAALERAGIAVGEIVVNRVLPAGRRCRLCDRRRAEERRVLAVIKRRLGRRRRLRAIPAEVKEPRGVAALTRIGRALVASKPASDLRARALPSGPSVFSVVEGPSSPAALSAIDSASLIFVGGKGGVGKTTVAAAAALCAARAAPERRVLLLSTDPAHSLGDVLAAPVGDAPVAVPNGPKNLRVRELDAPRALASRRGDVEAALNEIASAFGTAEPGRGAEKAAELMKLAPPGIDELFGLISVVDARDDYDLIVVDMAPTGHALRLLEVPDAAREWTQTLLRVLLKYKTLVRPGQLAEELVRVAKSVRELQALLRDAARTRFVAVTRAAEVPRLETERLVRRLRRLRVSTPVVVVNALTAAPGACARCRTIATAERKSLTALRRSLRRARRGVSDDCVIIQTPLSAPPPIGISALERWAGSWIA